MSLGKINNSNIRHIMMRLPTALASNRTFLYRTRLII